MLSHYIMLVNYVRETLNREEGQDLLEYAMLVALIALLMVTAIGAFQGALDTFFTDLATTIGTW